MVLRLREGLGGTKGRRERRREKGKVIEYGRGAESL
jgi:hypothetical protein